MRSQNKHKSNPCLRFGSVLIFIAGLCLSLSVGQDRVLPELQDVGVVENLGASLPLSAEFLNASGEKVVFGDFYKGDKPVLVNLVYYKCPKLCNLVVKGMVNGLNQMEWVPGKEFEIVTLSIDPKEGPELAAENKAGYLKTLKSPVQNDGWHFLTGTEENIHKISDALGFKYKVMDNGEFAHSGALFLTSPEGKISRVLYGVDFKGFDIKRGLLDAMEGKTISLLDKVIVFCYRYSEDANGYVLFAQNFMRGSGYFVLTMVGLLFGFLWFGEIRGRKKKLQASRAGVKH